MNDNQPGVVELFRRATDDLGAPVDDLVAAGLTRGRALRRRRRAGTAVAAVAVFGVIGLTATVVPSLLDPESSPEPGGVATQSSTPSPAASKEPQGERGGIVFEVPRAGAPELAVPAAEIPAAVAAIVGREGLGATRTDALYPIVNERYEKIVHFYWQGTVTSVIIEAVGVADETDCSNYAVEGRACETLANGRLTTSFHSTADQVTALGVTVWSRTGYRVTAISYNAPGGKDVPPTMPEPPLTKSELEAIASSDVWYE
jgi:hypothetical protein